jgi:hypothetical protein
VQSTATIANLLWSASNLPAYIRFRRSLGDPQASQERKLRDYISCNAQTAFGQAHGFGEIRNYEQFARCVPLSDYDSLEPWIERVRRGERNVLTRDPVTHLVPTSGSSGARKLIPFTAELQGEFNAAIGPWLMDMQTQFPALIGGPAYWSVTPAPQDEVAEKSAVPIGFDTDTAYLGGTRRRLADAIMAVPSGVQRAKSLEAFRQKTLWHLLRCRELRLISVWHPSFLTLLLDALPAHWEELLNGMTRERAMELRTQNPYEPASIWPRLRVISCWGDGNAEIALKDLVRRFPGVCIQRKGLLATEAVITIPFSGRQLLAVRSHFFEFLDRQGRVHLAHDLKMGEEYEIVVTTAGGLCRYRLRDQVRVAGFFQRTPALQFLGRAGVVSDLCGEKISEAFANQVIQQLLVDFALAPPFILLAPDEGDAGCCYTLFVEGAAPMELGPRLDQLLCRNPHYAWCRQLGQLQPPRLFRMGAGGYQTFATRETEHGGRMGDVKPRVFSLRTGWCRYFNGSYVNSSNPVFRPCINGEGCS